MSDDERIGHQLVLGIASAADDARTGRSSTPALKNSMKAALSLTPFRMPCHHVHTHSISRRPHRLLQQGAHTQPLPPPTHLLRQVVGAVVVPRLEAHERELEVDGCSESTRGDESVRGAVRVVARMHTRTICLVPTAGLAVAAAATRGARDREVVSAWCASATVRGIAASYLMKK